MLQWAFIFYLRFNSNDPLCFDIIYDYYNKALLSPCIRFPQTLICGMSLRCCLSFKCRCWRSRQNPVQYCCVTAIIWYHTQINRWSCHSFQSTIIKTLILYHRKVHECFRKKEWWSLSPIFAVFSSGFHWPAKSRSKIILPIITSSSLYSFQSLMSVEGLPQLPLFLTPVYAFLAWILCKCIVFIAKQYLHICTLKIVGSSSACKCVETF